MKRRNGPRLLPSKLVHSIEQAKYDNNTLKCVNQQKCVVTYRLLFSVFTLCTPAIDSHSHVRTCISVYVDHAPRAYATPTTFIRRLLISVSWEWGEKNKLWGMFSYLWICWWRTWQSFPPASVELRPETQECGANVAEGHWHTCTHKLSALGFSVEEPDSPAQGRAGGYPLKVRAQHWRSLVGRLTSAQWFSWSSSDGMEPTYKWKG